MYKLMDSENKVIAMDADITSLKVDMLRYYCTEEIPRLAKFMSIEDLMDTIAEDRITAVRDGMIVDYMEIVEG